MKKQLILLSSLYSLGMMAQHDYCGFDHYMQNQKEFIKNEKNTSVENEEKYHLFNHYQNFSTENQIFSTQNFTPYNGPIYEIPVVVHIIESNSTEGTTDNRTLKLTDDEVKTWIENTNKIYATTYGNGFFREGPGQKDGTIMPFRLVLAKRDKNLQPTTGIFRHNGDSIPGYGLYGVKNGLGQLNAPKAEDIVSKYPHWQEDLYYNIYIVVGVDGYKQADGPGGFAGLPSYGDNGYHTFIPVARVKREHDVTLAHEFGHSLGLLHTFQGGSDTSCPPGDNDGVDDTEVIMSFPCIKDAEGNCERPVNENDINPCTNQYFQGTQYNIMGYSYERKKFTAGQREKVINEFFKHNRSKNLAKSRGGEAILEETKVILSDNRCTPSRSFPFNPFPKKVTLENIENTSKSSNPYIDNTINANIWREGYTDLIENKETSISIEEVKPGLGNGEYAQVWIDYNNNRIFEDNELIIDKKQIPTDTKKLSVSFTPKANAIKNTYLRMRVKTDFYIYRNDACATTQGGQVEDFAVRIVEERKPDPPVPDPAPNTNYEGRVGINTAEPQATLDIREVSLDQLPAGQSQGVLFPSFTTEQRDKFQNVEEGTMIFNTTLKCLEIYKGSELKWQCVQ